MLRKIIKIDTEKCNGCGLCAKACHEGAIGMKDGKAVLMREDYCDGLGDCLPACPTNAISFEEREAPEYNEAAVLAAKAAKNAVHTGCPGSMAKSFAPDETPSNTEVKSRLGQWPVQIKLMPVSAPYFEGPAPGRSLRPKRTLPGTEQRGLRPDGDPARSAAVRHRADEPHPGRTGRTDPQGADQSVQFLAP